jgi:hypothetical protein
VIVGITTKASSRATHAIERPTGAGESNLASTASVKCRDIARQALAGKLGLTALGAMVDRVATESSLATALTESTALTLQVLRASAAAVRRDI